MTNPKQTCSTHHKAQTANLCQHLVNGNNAGFHTAMGEQPPYQLYPDAWCDQCQEVLNQQGEWDTVASQFAAFSAHCSQCYYDARKANWQQDENAYQALLAESFAYLQQQQSALIAEYDLNQYDRWDWDQASGKLVFSLNGQQQLALTVSFSGSLSTQSNTWMWAWANTSLLDTIKTASRDIFTLGQKRQYLPLAAAIWPADEVDGWEMTAIMAKHLNAIGAYRTKDEKGFTYMIIHEVASL